MYIPFSRLGLLYHPRCSILSAAEAATAPSQNIITLWFSERGIAPVSSSHHRHSKLPLIWARALLSEKNCRNYGKTATPSYPCAAENRSPTAAENSKRNDFVAATTHVATSVVSQSERQSLFPSSLKWFCSLIRCPERSWRISEKAQILSAFVHVLMGKFCRATNIFFSQLKHWVGSVFL